MMNIQTPSLPFLRQPAREPVASRPATGPAPTAGKDPAGFASLLRQTQAAPASRPAPARASERNAKNDNVSDNDIDADAETTDAPDTANPTEAHAAPVAQGRLSRASAAGKPRPAEAAGSMQRGAKSATDAVDGRDRVPPDAAADKAALQTLPPVLEPLPSPLPMPSLEGPERGMSHDLTGVDTNRTGADSAGPAAAAADASRLAAADAAQAASTGPTGPNSVTAKADAAATNERSDKALANDARSDASTSAGLFAQTINEQRAVEKAPAPLVGASAVDGTGAAPAAGATFAPNPTAGSHPAAPVAVALATPVTAPAFAQELGLRMSVLARDGVQHAELHLNPADMGPVSVHIVMDGSRAQVDFGADVAATRAAIEAGLPALAGALRDAGFTLAGGGVSQHSRGRGDSDSSAGGDGGPAGPRGRRIDASALDAATGAAHRAQRRTVSLGGLDLYA